MRLAAWPMLLAYFSGMTTFMVSRMIGATTGAALLHGLLIACSATVIYLCWKDTFREP